MKKYCFFIVMLWLSQTIVAQAIKGKIIDKNNNPVEFANVVELSLPDSTFVNGAVTNKEGIFSITDTKNTPFQSGKILLKFSDVGYKTIFCIPSSPDAGTLIAQEDTKTLNEVVVKGNKPLFSMKGAAIVANVSGTTLEKEIYIKDLLRKIPGMIVDKGELTSINGTPIYYINNRKVESFNEVAQLEIKNIDKIEVNTNPGAQYDASVGAVVKIYLKERENGWSAQVDGDYQRNHKNGNHENLHLNYQHNGLNLFGTLGYGDERKKSRQYIVMDIATHDTLWEQRTLLIPAHSAQKDYSYSLGADYTPNNKYNLGVKYDGDFQKMIDLSPSNTELYANGTLYTDLSSVSNLRDNNHNHHINIYMNDNIGKQSLLEIYTDYVNKSSGRKQDVNEKSDKYGLDETNSRNHANYNLYAYNATYSHTINTHNSYTTGIEMSSVTGNSILNYQNNKLQGSKSKTLENKIACFASYKLKLKMFSVNAGLRYEQVHSKYTDCLNNDNDIKRNYGNLFPSVDIIYSMHNGITNDLSYRSSITRPDFGKLNNYSYYLNRYSYQEGNPDLVSQIMHSFNYSMQYKFLYLRLGYAYNKNYIGTYFYSSPTDSSSICNTWANYKKEQELSAMLNIHHQFNFYEPSLMLYGAKRMLKVNVTDGTNSVHKPFFVIDSDNNFHLPANILLDIEYEYTSSGSSSYFIFHSMNIFNMSIQKSFLNDNLQLSMQVNDLFHNNISKYNGNINNISFYQKEDQDQRIFSVSLVYRFNNYKNKYKGKVAAQDEINRL